MKLEAKDITIRLGAKDKKLILDSVGFTAKDGEFLSLLGASGAGKSTLLKILSGILIQDEGSVLFDGTSVDGLPSHKRKVGFVFQDTRLFPHMNVEENVAFPCKMARMPKREREERAHALLERVQLRGFEQRDVMSLSGGQQQRVALARALAGRPSVLLLDEPFSGLDENLRDEMRSLVLNLHREFEITTIMVTHDAIEALEMSDHVVYLSQGKVVQDGSPRELFSHPASYEIASCFGECSILDGIVEEGVFIRGTLRLPAPNSAPGQAQAVVRYSDVELREQSELDPTSKQCVDARGIPVRCSVYRGDRYLIRLDVEGQVLTALSGKPYESGTLLTPRLATQNCFVYPNHHKKALTDA